jgi:hypothetical protein
MQQIIAPNSCTPKGDDGTSREARAITGWPLQALTQLDRQGARGLVADLTHAGTLTRQAAYVAIACVDLDTPAEFLRRLGVACAGAEGVGVALRRRRARDVIAAAFCVEPSAVPAGYLRALARIKEAGVQAPGVDAFARPGTYRLLFDLLHGDRQGRRANAVRYSKKMRSDVVDAAMALDPILAWREILDATGSPKRVAAANAMLAMIRACLSMHDDEELVAAMRRSLGQSGGAMSAFAKRALERADRLPTPIPAAEGVRPLQTGADYIDLGKRLCNCAAMLDDVLHPHGDGEDDDVLAALEEVELV